MQSFLLDYLSGVAGGIAVCVVGHPFDTTKTRLQTAPKGFYKNTLDVITKTIQWEGLWGFYAGIYSPLVGQMVFRAVSFSSYFYSVTLTSKMLPSYTQDSKRSTSPPSVQALVVAGGFTGFVISFIETPIDLIKTKIQIQIIQAKVSTSFKPQYTTTVTCFRHIVTKHGFLGLWQGWTATAVRNVPANAVFFPVNDIVKRTIAYKENIPVSDLPLTSRLVAGAMAGLCYWVGTYPLDVIKGKLQAQEYESRLSWRSTAALIYRDGGIKGFVQGLLPCAARAVPACSAMFYTVDAVRESGRRWMGVT